MGACPDDAGMIFPQATDKFAPGRFMQPFKISCWLPVAVHTAAASKIYFTVTALQHGHNKIIAESIVANIAAKVPDHFSGFPVHNIEPMIERADPYFIAEYQ